VSGHYGGSYLSKCPHIHKLSATCVSKVPEGNFLVFLLVFLLGMLKKILTFINYTVWLCNKKYVMTWYVLFLVTLNFILFRITSLVSNVYAFIRIIY
jgi:hypothetical protein